MRGVPVGTRRSWAVVLLILLVVGFAGFLWLDASGCEEPGTLSAVAWESVLDQFATRSEAPAGVEIGEGLPVATPTAGAARPTVLPPPDDGVLLRQRQAYHAHRPRSVLELQQFRRSTTIVARSRDGRAGTATLINLNPVINEWYLLELAWSDGCRDSYHLVNVGPATQDLELHAEFPAGLLIATGDQRRSCELWSERAESCVDDSFVPGLTQVPLCQGQVLLRRRTTGARTARERATDFLRDRIWGGEQLTVLVRSTIYRDAELERVPGDVVSERAGGRRDQAPTAPPDGPRPARVRGEGPASWILPRELGIAIEGEAPLYSGHWYRAAANRGVFVSVITPGALVVELAASGRSRLNDLDSVERDALVYLIAFDLERFELGFALGTDHPRVGWSERVPAEMRDPALPGPDGIGDIAPLVSTGSIPEHLAGRAVATFVGGFKRQHGAFRWGPLARSEQGSHYGFIESGVVLSKLAPGLSTLIADGDGGVRMKTWTRADDASLGSIRHARQNGVPLLELDPSSGAAIPGDLVARWGEGNWSGTQDGKLRSVRAGACLQRAGERSFLIYGYFSGATPSAMTRVFEGYGCEHAMLLDMNALEHTYLALYEARAGELVVEHLVRGMDVLDRTIAGKTLPRFLGYADNRDFFYLLQRELPGGQARP